MSKIHKIPTKTEPFSNLSTSVMSFFAFIWVFISGASWHEYGNMAAGIALIIPLFAGYFIVKDFRNSNLNFQNKLHDTNTKIVELEEKIQILEFESQNSDNHRFPASSTEIPFTYLQLEISSRNLIDLNNVAIVKHALSNSRHITAILAIMKQKEKCNGTAESTNTMLYSATKQSPFGYSTIRDIYYGQHVSINKQISKLPPIELVNLRILLFLNEFVKQKSIFVRKLKC